MTRTLIYNLSVLLSLIYISYEAGGANEQNRGPSANCAAVNDVGCEIQGLKLKLRQLESTFGEATEKRNAKDHHIQNLEESIELMNDEIKRLQSLLPVSKGASSEEVKLKALEEEIKFLQDISRKNQLDIRILESRADEAENQVGVTASQVEQMVNIVTEMWIQVQQLEQALKITERRRAEIQQQIGSKKGIFFKLMRALSKGERVKVVEFFHQDAFSKSSTWSLYVSEYLKQVEGFLSDIKKYHHKLQGAVKHEMQRYKLTSLIANKEVVFIVGLEIDYWKGSSTVDSRLRYLDGHKDKAPELYRSFLREACRAVG